MPAGNRTTLRFSESGRRAVPGTWATVKEERNLRNTMGMRSNAPRVPHDATVELGPGGRARAVNLSTGGIFVAADEPLDPGAQVHLKINLRDGAQPVDVDGEVVWREDGGMALRFVDLDDVARRRITRLVQKREPTQFGRRDVRIHLPELSAPLRARARDLTERGVMIEAELPWLRLGSAVTTELSPDRACDGHVQWIGLDVTRSGAARLRIFVDLSEDSESLETMERSASEVPLGPPDDGTFMIRRPRRLLWPAIALAALVTTGVMAALLVRRPPTPLLLPTAPPEREAPMARAPFRLSVPTADKTTMVAAAVPTPAVPTAAMPAGPAPVKKSRARHRHR